MKDLDLKKHSLSLYFVIAYALPMVAVAIVILTTGLPSVLVAKELSAAAMIVVMAMVRKPLFATRSWELIRVCNLHSESRDPLLENARTAPKPYWARLQ
jgi:hypothetical protein